MWLPHVVLITATLWLRGSESQFFECHDDPALRPSEGPLKDLAFTWLGALQYIHVKNGNPHYFRVPRVVLVSRRFALATAADASNVPTGYALGNIVLGDYERDEEECRVSVEQIAAGAQCEPGVLLVPLADVLLHPEHKHFGARHSLALLKLLTPIQSKYVVPACLPYKDYLVDKSGRIAKEKLTHIDFSSDVPRDFVDEEKEVSEVTLLPRELCFLYDSPDNSSRLTRGRLACTTGCGLRSGAPTTFHEHTGHWSVVAIAQGGSPCADPLRARRPAAPPRHTVIHPYVPWITAAITGKAVGSFAKDDPFGFAMPRASLYDTVAHGWVGHWWMGGLRCYDRGDNANDMFKFYHEIFQVKPVSKTFLTYYLEINAMRDTLIICVKVGMPYRLARPRVWALDSPETKVRIPTLSFQNLYKFQVEAWAYNSTQEQSSSSDDSSD